MMNDFGWVLLRTTACTTFAWFVANFLLKKQQVRSPGLHRLAAILILLQGWAVIPLVMKIPISESLGALSSHDTTMSYRIVEQQIPVTAEHVEAVASDAAPATGTWIVLVWGVGLVLVIGRFAQQYVSLIRKLPLGQATTNDTWLSEWNALRAQFHVGDSTQFRIAHATGPLVCFVPFFYLLLVPGHLWTVLAGSQRRAILLHELAHVKRGDLWKSACIRCLALPQWFNPFAWRAVSAFDEAAEWACDDFVVNARDQHSLESYMSALLRIAESHVCPVPASVAIRGGILSRRIRRLVQSPVKEERKMTKMLAPTLLIGLVLIQSIRIHTVFADEVAELAAPAPTESRTVALAKTGLQPYLVGSPDLISIKTTVGDQVDASKPAIEINGQFLVQPDGTIDIASLGKIKIDGLTTEKIESALRAHFGDTLGKQKVLVTVEKKNSKSIFIHLNSNRESVLRMPCSAETNLLAVLRDATFPHPVNFSKSNIQLKRSYQGKTLLVAWEDIHGRPDSEHNHKLLPGDRIVITPNDKDRTVRATVAQKPRPIPASPIVFEKQVEVNTDVPIVRIEMMIFEDTKGTLDEFESLSKSSVMFGDAKQTKATLNVFAKNKLINTLARPQVMCVSGQSASIAINPTGLNVDVTPTVQDDSHVVVDTKVNVHRTYNGRQGQLDIQTSAIIEKGKTIVMKARPHPHQERAQPSESAVYVAFTADVVRK